MVDLGGWVPLVATNSGLHVTCSPKMSYVGLTLSIDPVYTSKLNNAGYIAVTPPTDLLD